MRQLPQVVDGTRELIRDGRLAMITASYDRDKAPLLDVIDEYGIEYPVIWQNGDPNRGNVDQWNIRGIPTTVLINPAGEIVADLRAGEDFQQVLEYFIDNGEELGVVTLDGSSNLNDDGSVTVDMDIYSSRHRPVDVNVEVIRVSEDANGDPVYTSLSEEGHDYSFTKEFRMFGDARHSLTISDYGEGEMLIIIGQAVYPGSEELNGGEGVGPSFYSRIALQ